MKMLYTIKVWIYNYLRRYRWRTVRPLITSEFKTLME